MKTQYKTVDTATLPGLILAESLKEDGWKIGYSSLWRIQFYRTIKTKGEA